MKKFLIILSMLISLPCFASNDLQLQAEKAAYKAFSDVPKEKLISLIQILIIKDDFTLYENDKNSDTMYLRLLNEKSKFCDSLKDENILNCSYIKKAQKKYLDVANYKLSSKNLDLFISEFNKDKIIINDVDYKKIPKIVKSFIEVFALIK